MLMVYRFDSKCELEYLTKGLKTLFQVLRLHSVIFLFEHWVMNLSNVKAAAAKPILQLYAVFKCF